MDLQEWSLLGNSLQTWLIALSITIGILASTVFAVRALTGRTARRPTLTDPSQIIAPITATLVHTRTAVLVILSLYAGSLVLELPEQTARWAGTIALLALMVQLALWGNALILHFMARYQRQHLDGDSSSVTSARAIGYVARIALFTVVALLALDNIPGVEITTLIASLGIGGIAVALALQNILSDLFASLSIALDQPFVAGDFIVVDDLRGTVEKVGLKTTRVKSLSGEQIVFSNNDLLSSRVRNYKRMNERRATMTVGVTYQTSYEQLAAIPDMMRQIIEAQEHTRFDRAHFRDYGDFSLNFEIVYYLLLPDYNLYMDTQQAINLALFQRFEAQGIEFAYPTQTVFVEQNQGPRVTL